jgi:gluconolactonase
MKLVSYLLRSVYVRSVLYAFYCLTALGSVNAYASVSPHIDIYDESALAILDKNAFIEVLGEGFSWSEGPLWLPKEKFLLFSDVPKNTIFKYKKGEGISVYLKPSGATGISEHDSKQGSNGLLLNNSGQLVMMQHGDRRVALMNAPLNTPKADFQTLAGKFDNKRFNSPNDGVFHSKGDLYFTDPPYGLNGGMEDPHKALPYSGIFRLSKNGDVNLEDKSTLYPNGIALTNDESRVIVAVSDRAAAKWYQFDVAADGSLSNKRVFFDVSDLVGKENESGLPDGMAVHSKGYIFATGPGGVFVFTENGELLAKIRTGKSTANCTLSADEKTLYMTAHDTLMSVKLK